MQTICRRPEAVLFDFSHTLISLVHTDHRAGYQAILSLAQGNVPVERVMAFREQLKLSERKDVSGLEIPFPQLTRLIFQTFGLTPRVGYEQLETVFWDAAYRCAAVQGVRELLMMLKSAGVICGIVSNFSFSGATLEYELRKHGLRDPFAFVLSSADVSFRKPDPAIFRLAAGLTGLPDAGSIWHVGDTFEPDVVGSRSVGLYPVWFNPDQRPLPIGEQVFEVKSMEALRTCLAPLMPGAE